LRIEDVEAPRLVEPDRDVVPLVGDRPIGGNRWQIIDAGSAAGSQRQA
jgi:hypothetical protein